MSDALPVPVWVSATFAKRGNRAEENEDATAADALRFAVSDGATEGWESGPWAARLTAAYVEKPPEPTTFAEWLAAARKWSPPEPSGPVPWYAEEKREQGSFATLLGMELRRSRKSAGWAWRAVAVGDTCLFHVRGGELLLSAPLTARAEFGNRPALVPSAARPCPAPGWFAGRAAADDLFLLATDAVAAALLAPDGLAPALAAVRAVLELRDAAKLSDWCRAVQDAHNDDVTVLAVRLPPT